jgi:hypothetical protein
MCCAQLQVRGVGKAKRTHRSFECRGQMVGTARSAFAHPTDPNRITGSQDEVKCVARFQTLVVRSAAKPRVSNHEDRYGGRPIMRRGHVPVSITAIASCSSAPR